MKILTQSECYQIGGGLTRDGEDLLWFITGASVTSFFVLAIAVESGQVYVAAPSLMRATGEVLILGMSAFVGGYLVMINKAP